jgi:hypothetical protein
MSKAEEAINERREAPQVCEWSTKVGALLRTGDRVTREGTGFRYARACRNSPAYWL